jgi:arabinan endo-1,5-alpha-L-arabinosidase
MPARLAPMFVLALLAPACVVDSEDEALQIAASTAFPLADPDTVIARDGSYITYGTTVGANTGARCGGTGRLYVPYLVHGSGSQVGMPTCAAGDAMPGGPGTWAEPGGGIWAPGVVRFGDRYFMYYTASRQGSGQKCLGVATSYGARGPFESAGEFACPSGGRWALDANPFVQGDSLYVAYRDDAITSFPETGISIVRADAGGHAIWSTRRSVLRSTDITWDTIRISGDTRVVENPSVFERGGRFYVAYSGNNWDSARYATGIVDCGTSLLSGGICTPVGGGVSRPYFGFTGPGGLDPLRGLPGNHPGSGGMDVFKAANGSLRAVWHWRNPANGRRYVQTGTFGRNGTQFVVSVEAAGGAARDEIDPLIWVGRDDRPEAEVE